jgi:hypothetical protein
MENYWEGWGFSDRIPVTISATPRKIEILKLELAKSFPDNQVDELDSRNIRFYAREEQLKKLKKFVTTLNGKIYYENGGKLESKKLVYVLYDPTPKAIKIFNENGRTYLNWWQSDLNRGESEQLLKKLQMQNLILGGLRYTGDSSDLKFEQGGDIGEALASSNPYIGGAKVIQGIAPESVSALDKKMARKINPDPNRPIFFENGGVSKYVGGGGVSKKEPKYYVFEVSYSMRKRGENRNQAGIYKQTITESATTEKGAEREAIKTIRSMHKYENVVFNHIAPKLIKEMTLLEYIESQRPRKYDNGGGVDIIAPFGTLVSKNKKQKLEYKKVGSNFEFMIYEGVNNPVSNYSRTSFKKSKNGSRIMNYEEFLKFIHSNGFVADQKYALGGGVPRKMELYDAVLYEGKQYDISIKNGVVGLKNLSQGAWGSDYPFIPLSKVDINDVTDMYGNKVEISNKYENGGLIDEIKTKYQLAGNDSNGVYTYSKRVADEIASKYGGDVQQDGSKWYVSLNEKYALGGGVENLEMTKILEELEKHYLFGSRGLNLITDIEQVQNPQNTTYFETIARKDFFETQLYEWLKKYDIVCGVESIWVWDLEKMNNWKTKIKELKSNGYLVVKKISAPDKQRTKSFRYIAIKQKFDNGGSVGQTDYSVARIILQQLGGQGKLVVMTGANNFIAFSNGVSFKLKSKKANYVKITLNGNDLYDVQFQKLFGMKSKVVAEYNDIYFDQLIPIVEKETGMYLKMFKKGGMVSTQNRDMVISQLKAIHHHQKEMLDTLKNSGEVEAWVLAKVSNASSDLSNVAHYLEFKE